MKAIVYGTPRCSWCDRVTEMLGENEIEVEKIDVSESKASSQHRIDNIIKNFDGYEYYLYFDSSSTAWPKQNLKSMKKVAGKTTTTVPQVIIDGNFVGGYTEVERFINRL